MQFKSIFVLTQLFIHIAAVDVVSEKFDDDICQHLLVHLLVIDSFPVLAADPFEQDHPPAVEGAGVERGPVAVFERKVSVLSDVFAYVGGKPVFRADGRCVPGALCPGIF